MIGPAGTFAAPRQPTPAPSFGWHKPPTAKVWHLFLPAGWSVCGAWDLLPDAVLVAPPVVWPSGLRRCRRCEVKP